MAETGVFKWVWRFNAIVIALGAAGLVLILLGEFADDLFRTRPAHGVEVAPPPEAAPVLLRYGVPEIGAGGLMMLPVVQDDPNRGASFSGSKYGQVALINYAFLPANGPQSWLFEGNRQLIVADHALAQRQDGKVLARALAVVTQDSDGDGTLTAEDVQDLFLTDADLQGKQLLQSGIKGLRMADLMSPDLGVVLIETDQGLEALRLALPSGQVIARQAVAAPEAAQ